MLVGEQPGDQEDLAGAPFAGPAGRVLNTALEEAGIARGDIYVTNAVKHFKFEPRGKRRIHERPNSRELAACRPWLDEEAARVEREYRRRDGERLRGQARSGDLHDTQHLMFLPDRALPDDEEPAEAGSG